MERLQRERKRQDGVDSRTADGSDGVTEHYSVLLNETIELLDIRDNGIYVDGTLGRAGHAKAILKKIPNGQLIAFDKDLEAIKTSESILKPIGTNFTLVHRGFENLDTVLDELGVDKIDGMILDLGVSSPQFDDGERGFSYRYDAKLDMRMNQEQELSAYEVVNNYSYQQLVKIFYEYGEEKFAKNIARMIEKRRYEAPIATTLQLVDVIKEALPAKVVNAKGHPAKKVFQAIRIEVNDELGALRTVLDSAINRLAPQGRLAVITFHSLEDRLVKKTFAAYAKDAKVDKRLPINPQETQKDYQLINGKPIIASTAELDENKRSHSAKLRVIMKVR